MDREVDSVRRAEKAFEDAESQVRHLTSELELAEAQLVIARIRLARAKQTDIRLARAKQTERESRGW